ncbi:MAG: hypothetical protein AAF685_14535 [Cyanobacteria bacterium P01_C01_bin.89]
MGDGPFRRFVLVVFGDLPVSVGDPLSRGLWMKVWAEGGRIYSFGAIATLI